LISVKLGNSSKPDLCQVGDPSLDKPAEAVEFLLECPGFDKILVLRPDLFLTSPKTDDRNWPVLIADGSVGGD